MNRLKVLRVKILADRKLSYLTVSPGHSGVGGLYLLAIKSNFL